MTNLYDDVAGPTNELVRPARALTIGAHPDDAEFGCGALVARWASAGTEVTLCIVTDGSKGSWDPEIDDDELVALRRSEQKAAAAVLGATGIVHLGHVDGELEYSLDLRIELARQIRRFRPDVVLSHDPWQRYQLHPDHRVAGRAAVDAVVAAREPRSAMGSSVPAHRPSALLLWNADEPDHAEPVTDEWLARKVEALACHASQAETTMGGDLGEPGALDRLTRRLRDWHVESGARLGCGPAETFKRLTP